MAALISVEFCKAGIGLKHLISVVAGHMTVTFYILPEGTEQGIKILEMDCHLTNSFQEVALR